MKLSREEFGRACELRQAAGLGAFCSEAREEDGAARNKKGRPEGRPFYSSRMAGSQTE
jgi:hypothetical protein